MIRTYEIDENYKTVKVFDEIEKGDVALIPFDKKRHLGLRLEACRRNKDLRLIGVLKSKMDVRYRVSYKEYPGFSAVFCIK